MIIAVASTVMKRKSITHKEKVVLVLGETRNHHKQKKEKLKEEKKNTASIHLMPHLPIDAAAFSYIFLQTLHRYL